MSSQAKQFRALFQVVYHGQVTVDIGNAATGSGTAANTTATIPGAALGDMVLVAAQGSAENANSKVVAEVSAANTVRFTVLNNSAGAVDPASKVYNLTVLRPRFD